MVAVSDGELSPEELLMINELKREIDLSREFEPHHMSTDSVREIFNTRSARVATFIALTRIVPADGAF